MVRALRMLARPGTFAFATAMAVSLLAAPASAQQPAPPRDEAGAQALFDEAKRLMDIGKFALACPKLVESQRLDPGGGTTIALAICFEGEGKLASAWATYNQALTEARRDKRADREKRATERIAALTPRLTRIVIRPLGKEPGLEVKRNGIPISSAMWGTPLPVDPGDHVFEATAPGKKPWTGNAKITSEGMLGEVTIPVLENAPTSSASTPGAATAPKPETPEPKKAEPEPQTSSDRLIWSGVVGGVGLISLGIGSVLGVSAMSGWTTVHSACPDNKCTKQSDIDDGVSVRKRADLSTVLVGLGVVAIASAVVIYVAWPSDASKSTAAARHEKRTLGVSPFVSATGGGAMIGGSL